MGPAGAERPTKGEPEPHGFATYLATCANGRGIDELLSDYPYLAREDVLQALRYAAFLVEDREIDLASA